MQNNIPKLRLPQVDKSKIDNWRISKIAEKTLIVFLSTTLVFSLFLNIVLLIDYPHN